MPPVNIKFLTGAPAVDTLDWDDQDLLTSFTTPALRFLNGTHDPVIPPPEAASSWRFVPLNGKPFGAPLLRIPPAHDTNSSIDHSHQDFFEHSFAVHADLQSSQLAPQLSGQCDDESTFITESSIVSTPPDDSALLTGLDSVIPATRSPDAPHHRHFMGPVSTIQAIPNADFLNRLQPQTMTVNLVVGVISAATVRPVKVRRGNYDMEIIELLVGDETKAGFSVSSWHVPLESQQKGEDASRKTLLALRPCDIILLERLALCSFKDQVFGQCLNKRSTKSLTVLSTLLKADQIRGLPKQDIYPNLSPSVTSKVRRVQDWVTSFIGPAKIPLTRSHKSQDVAKVPNGTETIENPDEYLPPDSQ